MVKLENMAGAGFRDQMMDALVFSLAVYESDPEKILSVLRYNYDLPVGALELLHLEGLISRGIPSCAPGRRRSQFTIVGRSTHGHVVVACRGTADLADFIADLKIIPKWLRSSQAGACAHMGFVERAESVELEPFLALLSRGERLVFTGHSLGGAVSSLLALRVLEAAESHHHHHHRSLCTHLGQVQCITFGAPLFASPALARCINDKYPDRFCHVVSKRDLVPRIVPLVRIAQRIAGYGSDEIAEGLHLARACLEVVESATKLPVATAVKYVGALIPGPMRAVVRTAIKFLWLSRTPQQYSFAGKFLFLDPMSDHDERSVTVAKGQELNAFPSEVAFALGLHVNVVEHHGLSSYQRGLAKGLRSRLLAHIQNNKKGLRIEIPARRDPWNVAVWQSPRTPRLRRNRSSKYTGSVPQRHSIDCARLTPAVGMAAAAMEAAAGGLRTARLARMRKSMERNFADCAATLSVLREDQLSRVSTPCAGRAIADSECSAGQPSCPSESMQRPVNERLPSLGEASHGSSAGSPSTSQGLTLRQCFRGPGGQSGVQPKRCTLCRLSRDRAAHSEEARAAKGFQDTLQEGSHDSSRVPQKGRLHVGWICHGAVWLALATRSLSTWSVACCVVRLLLGSPLF